MGSVVSTTDTPPPLAICWATIGVGECRVHLATQQQAHGLLAELASIVTG